MTRRTQHTKSTVVRCVVRGTCGLFDQLADQLPDEDEMVAEYPARQNQRH